MSRSRIGCSAFAVVAVLAALARFATAYERAEYKAQNPNPTAQLSCPQCRPGIPIYDSWSTERKIVAYGQDGEQCEVTANYTTSYISTLAPRAQYTYVDREPHLYVRCPSGRGFVYTTQTTFRP